MNTKMVCDELDISAKTLRIYEECEIVVPKRDENNYRNYSKDDILKLRQVSVLRKMDIPLKNIKLLLQKDFGDYKIIRGLDLQLKVVEKRINELESIKDTLIQSINDALVTKEEDNSDEYFKNINKCLNDNMEKRKGWTDKWGFDSWAKNYDNSIKDYDELDLLKNYDIVIDTVVNEIYKNNAIKVLDIGCGTGNLYGKLKKGTEFTGIDQSIEMLLQAKSKYENINLRMGNFLDEPYVENEFDAIVSTYAFHHLTPVEKESSLNLMLRYLKPGGQIIIADLMFLNEAERLKKKDYFYSNGREDLWEVIEDEYYTDIDKIKNYANLLNCKVSYEHIANFTWILKIRK